MPQSDRAAIDVYLAPVELKIAYKLGRDNSKGFIDLIQINVVLRHAGLFQHFPGSGHRRVEHERGAIAHIGSRDNPRARFEPMLLRIGLAGEQQCGCAVHHAAGIAGAMEVLDVHIGIALIDQFLECRGAFIGRHIRQLLKRGR